MQVYLVGGAVRDQLLGVKVTDRDWVVVGATPQQMLDLNYKQVGKDFPVFLHPQTGEEYALARTERKVSPGYVGFEFNTSPDVTLEQDLQRRDLTINAIAQTESGEIIDPFGGVDDLHNDVLRHVSPAFVEDPVRILRVARFAARLHDFKFTIAPETMILMRDMVRAGEVNALVAERVWKELERALGESQPQIFFRVCREVGALSIVMPEIDAMFGVPLPPDLHPEVDLGEHAMMALQTVSSLGSDSATRFATVLAGLGGSRTSPGKWPEHPEGTKATSEMIDQLAKRLRVPSEHRELAQLVAKTLPRFAKTCVLSAEDTVTLLEDLDAFRRRDRFYKYCQAALANIACHPGDDLRNFSHLQCLTAKMKLAANVDAQDIIKQGFSGAEIKTQLHQARVVAIKQASPGSQKQESTNEGA